MGFRSVYIVQSQILPLGSTPFNIKGELRPSFEKIFRSKKCFSDMSTIIYDYYRAHNNPILKYWNVTNEELVPSDFKPIPITSAPFISNLGQICFNTRNAYFTDYAYLKQRYAFLIGKRVRYWDPNQCEQNYKSLGIDDDDKFFGYDAKINDQRMNNLYFELRLPLKLRADGTGGCKASGNLFVHIYPSGYIILQFALSLKNINKACVDDIMPLIIETRPWRKNNKWLWSSKFGKMTLNELHGRVLEEISMSLFSDGTSIKNDTEKWHTAMSFVSNSDVSKIPSCFFDRKYEVMRTKTFSKSGGEVYNENLFSSRQGIIYLYDSDRDRKSVLHSFWRIMAIYEFTLLKNQIYGDYYKLFNTEIDELKELHLSRFQKYKPNKLIKFNVYDSNIPRYLSALDKTILNASSFYRAVYSSISKGMSFDERRVQLNEELKVWETEIEKWESPEVRLENLMKKVLAPLRSIIGLK